MMNASKKKIQQKYPKTWDYSQIQMPIENAKTKMYLLSYTNSSDQKSDEQQNTRHRT
jgi:hypothetical protein